MASSHDRKNNGQVHPGKVGANAPGPANKPGPETGVDTGADQATDGHVQVGAAAEDRSQRGDRRDGARRTEQLVILSAAIVLGGVGLAFHPLWIGALVLMAVLWGYMASDIRSRGGGIVSDVVGTVVSEAKEVAKSASTPVSVPDQTADPIPISSSSTDGATVDKDDDGQEREAAGADQEAPPAGTSDDQEPTKRELYALAQEADIEGRSHMNKEELKEALES